MKIKEIKGKRVYVEMGHDPVYWEMSIWLDKEILRQYGIETKGLKVGMEFDPKDYMPKE